MILQALVEYYEALAAAGRLDKPGWSRVGVSYALALDDAGILIGVLPLKQEETQGKKTVLRPQSMSVPLQIKRSVNIAANFLCDNSTYFLGIDAKGKPERVLECFAACRDLHHQLLKGCSSPAAQAICRFFDGWNPQTAADCEPLGAFWDDIIGKGGNLIFYVQGSPAQNDAEIQAAWQRYYDSSAAGEPLRCLVTGQMAPYARLHPVVKNIRGGQAMGNSLVCFNDSADESYGCEKSQGRNAPISSYAAFAYGTALNSLLSDSQHVRLIGDTTVIFWAQGACTEAQDMFAAMFFGQTSETATDATLANVMHKLAMGQPVEWQGIPLDPQTRFYILGLAPNAARISVRFFLQDSFGNLAKKVQNHYDRLEIVRPAFGQYATLWLWNLLNETVNQNARNKTPAPQLAGDMLRAILTDMPYPATLYNGVQIRIRAESEVTRGRAAIIKAYLLKNTDKTAEYQNYKEVLTLELNEKSKYGPYVLGRMFSVLEDIQKQANRGINTTIKDRYFNSACAMPASVFPSIINLAQKHLKKLRSSDAKAAVVLEKRLADLMDRFETDYPRHLSLYDQGIFQLGYYHQTQRYQKKQEGTNNG